MWTKPQPYLRSKDSYTIFDKEILRSPSYIIHTKYWQQLDIYANIEWKCTDDDKIYKKLVKKDKIFQFLLGLSKNLDEVSGRILGTKFFPSIREAFAEVRREESRRKILLASQSASSTIEGSALAVRNPPKKGRG